MFVMHYRSGSKLIDKQRHESASGRISPFDNSELKSNDTLEVPAMVSLHGKQDGSIETLTPAQSLKADATHHEIIQAMRAQTSGFSFIKSTLRVESCECFLANPKYSQVLSSHRGHL